MREKLLFLAAFLLFYFNVNAQLTVSITHSNVSCNGRSDGSATATASGGIPPYSYSWSNGATTRTVSGLAPGAYTCTVTSLVGGTASAPVVITQPSPLSVTTAVTDVVCYGAATGSATVTASGGTAPYTYNWTPEGGTNATASNLTAGNYRCVIVDANGCDETVNVTVADGTPISYTTAQTNVKCKGQSNGSATVTTTVAGAPFTYSWSPSGGTAATATNLAAGTYTCTVTNRFGCDTAIIFNITEPAANLSATITKTDIQCFGENTGSATVKVTGGTAPYTYSWSPSGGTSATAGNLAPGTYTCNITDANGCTTSASATITSPAAGLSVITSKTDIACFGAATGSATVAVTGGTAPYTYSWSGGGGTAATASNLLAGTYTCNITDANGCKTTATVAIAQPSQLALSSTQTNILCNGNSTGSAKVTASGGVAPYTYSWSPSGGTAATASNLAAGSYTCTVTDANACTKTITVTITEPAALATTTSKVDILCFGSATGSATVNVTGGVTPYKYSWSPSGGNAATASNLKAGTYTCTVTDANGCTTTAQVTVAQQPQITFTTSQTNVACTGSTTGAATVTVSGGTPGYTYSWSPAGGSAATANGLAAGIYTCHITDANGCDTTATIILSEPPALTATATKTDISCNGANDGVINAMVSGGVPPYTYDWVPGGANTPTVSGVGPGTYTCTATDANGCTITGTVSLLQPTLLTATSSSTPVSCNGGSDGTATAMGSGGTTPYTYSWSPSGGTAATATGLAAGSYTCTIKDAKGCTATTTITVSQPAALSGTTSDVDVTCNGAANGSATVHPSGGTSPYTYAWSNGGTTQTINNLSPGNYTCVITDANGCTFNVTTPATITEPPALTASSTHTDVGCNGQATGTATATASGGTAPYTYQWSPSGGTGATATGLAAGNYTCTITDANGCTTTSTVTINQSTTLNGNFTATDVTCKGAGNGTATAAVTGGATPYSYSWTPGGATTPSISNLGPGTYTCVVTDANGCEIRQTVEVKEPTQLVLHDTIVNNVSCNGANDGCAKATPTGGTAPYTYSWSPGGGTGQTACGLAPGNYTTTVTDANGCTATSSVTVTEPPVLTATISSHNTTGAGNNDGAATANPSGGTAPYSYSWSPSGGNGQTADPLAPGTYTCTVTDANGCTTTQTVTITDPTGTGLGVYTNKSDIKCNGGSDGTASVTPYGGTAPYTYSWSPGGETTQQITGLAAGTYTCVVTDAASNTQTVTITINQPATLTASAVTGSNVYCHGGSNGSAIAIGQGGTAPYTYSWSNGGTTDTIANLTTGTYTVRIRDANGCTATASTFVEEPNAMVVTSTQTNVNCNGFKDGTATAHVTGGLSPYSYSWNNGGGGGQTATGLAPGNYTCTVTDNFGCTSSVTVTITEPDVLAASATRTNVSCNGAGDGSITALITGGTTPYTYSWDPGGETTVTINNLTPGTYTAFVTDANNCKVIGTVEITQPATLTVSTTQTNTSCNGATDGSTTVTAAGGTAPYTYSWSNGGTTATISNLAPGNYTCTVTDANRCTATANVTITQPAVVSARVTKTFITCDGGSDGSIALSGTGGTAPYTYLWNTGATTATITGLPVGSYTCTITDSHGCTGEVNVHLIEPLPITAAISQTNVDCNGNATGLASVVAEGGSGGYTYLWAPQGGTGRIATGLPAGAYTCTITDQSGCTGVIHVTITQPDVLMPNPVQTNVSCNGAADGKVVLHPTGGTAPYTYTWSNGSTDSTATGFAPGTHQYTITDANFCSVNGSFNISEPPALTATSSHTDVGCAGGSDGTAKVLPAGGRTPYTYLWSNGATGQTATGLVAGSYTCTVTDSSGCTTTTSTTVGEPTVLKVTVATTNVTCNGAGDGTAAITASGGTTNYSYLWSNGKTTANIIDLVPGTYICTISDAHNCDTTISVTITEPDLISFTTTHTNVLCNGAATGSATVTVSGGTVPYTYSWSPTGGTSSTANNLLAGTYTCTITDAHGCDTSVSITITEPTAITFTTSQVNVDCNGNNTGSATVTASGGVTPYTYFWSGGAGTNASASNLTAGTYTCVITDANNCSVTASVTITEPDELLALTSQTNVNCNGGNTGVASVSPIGGTSPYTYLWSNGGTTASISNLTAGTYTCTVTDSHNCVTTATVVVTEKTALKVVGIKNNVLCNGGSTGSISIGVSGGTSPYTYLWNTGATTAAVNNLPVGTYTVTVTDANGCDTTGSVTITEPPAITVATTQVDVNCNGSNTGSANITVSGGVTPYHYYWSNGSTTATASNLFAGTYTCTVTDANGCDTTATVTITEKPGLTGTATKTNVLCNGGSTGSITLSVSGGTSPYSYSWSNGGTTATINNLAAGVYTATITDANGCDTTVNVAITEPPVLSTSTSQVDVLCNGAHTGSAKVTATGGTAPYTFSWSNGSVTDTTNNIAAGTYTCTVTDANGCTATSTVTITEKTAVTGSVTQDNVLCHGGNSGSITLTAAGGTAPYTYLWSNGATTATINGLTIGTYTCTITDSNGCTGTVAATITEPPQLTFNTLLVSVNCHGSSTGSATIDAIGGTSPYSYLWNTGATTATISNLAAGTYTCTLTDANGCDTTATVTITEKPAITVNVTPTAVLCHGTNTGSIALAVSGGTSPYTYLWSNGATTATVNNLAAGTYTATITDVNGCDTTISQTITEPAALAFLTTQVNVNCNGGNTGSATVLVTGGTRPYNYHWSNGDTTAIADSLTAGTYTCQITDSNGCDTTATVTITEKAAITAAITQNNVLCHGGNSGSISITATGGTAPYTYLWSNGAATASISGLTIGTYTCTITDVNGCTGTVTATITEPATLTFTTTQVNVNCNGSNTGSATVTPAGGTTPYSYLWSNGATTATISNLVAGTFTCTITDANGCDTTASVTITQKAAITATATKVDVLCHGSKTGSIAVTVTGGTAPYTYLWSNGAATATINNLAAGTYTATITDTNGCDTTISETITEPDALSFTITQVNVNCNGANTGSAEVTAAGGNRPYTYSWSTGATTAAVDSLKAGVYTCKITDANGCDTTATITITEKAAIVITTTQHNVLCHGGNSGDITATATGGTAPYVYLWSTGATTATINTLTAGTYNVIVKDVNGCASTINVVITEPTAITVATSQVNVACNGSNTGSATVTATGGTAPYSYHWSNGAATATADKLAAGTYSCTITDANSCDTTVTVIIAQSSSITTGTTQTNILCNGAKTGSITATTSGGRAPYTYLWNTGESTATISGLPAGTYTYTVTDSAGCTATGSAILTQPTAMTTTVTHTNADCGGGNTGAVGVSVSGGVAPYTYHWNTGATTANVDHLPAGDYTCTITDANGCQTTAQVTVLSNGFEAVKLVDDASHNGTASEGELLTYTIRVKNTGTATINTITITDAVPDHTTFVSAAGGNINNNVITFTDANLAANVQKDYVLVVRTDQNLEGITQITNVAHVIVSTGSGTECSGDPMVAIPVVRIIPQDIVDLSIVKQTDNKSVLVGNRFDYTIIVSNKGATAKPVTVTDILPAGLTYLTSIPGKGVADYSISTRTITWILDSLANNNSEVLTIRVQADVVGNIINTATVTSPQPDSDTSNNRSTVTKEVVRFHIPNVITPNGDGSNDKFVIPGLDEFPENELSVFNRWNANVYERRNYQNDWDGSGLNDGTYFFILKVKDNDGVWHTYKGNVLLLRN